MITGHGGNIGEAAARAGLSIADITDMSSNTNPLGPMPGMLDYLKSSMECAVNLPEADSLTVVRAFAGMNNLDPAHVLAAGGTTQFIYSLPRIFLSGKALILGPTYADYADACAMNHMPYAWVFPEAGANYAHDPAKTAESVKDVDLVFVCNPNNPTGDLYSPEALQWLAHKCPDTVFVVDESYLPFVPDASSLSMARCALPNILVLRSFSKIFKVPGLRIGFAIAPKNLKQKLEAFQLPWSVGSLAQNAVLFAAENREDAETYIRMTADYVSKERKIMEGGAARSAGVTACPGATPFVLFQLPAGLDSKDVWLFMLNHGILIRDCTNFQGLGSQFVRISLKDSRSNVRAIRLLTGLSKNARV